MRNARTQGLDPINVAGKAFAHPLRARILAAIAEGEQSPKMLAVEFGEPLGNVSYHVKALLELGLIRQTRAEPRRGALEHYYVLDVERAQEVLRPLAAVARALAKSADDLAGAIGRRAAA